MGDRGRIVLPAEARRRAGLSQGDRLVVVVEGEGRVRLVSRTALARDAQGMWRTEATAPSLVEDLLTERRAEAALEQRETAGAPRRGKRVHGRTAAGRGRPDRG